MIYFPPLRRLLLPALLLLIFILYYRSSERVNTNLSSYIIQAPVLSAPGTRILVQETNAQVILASNTSENHLSPDRHFYYEYNAPDQKSVDDGTSRRPTHFDPASHPAMQQLYECPIEPNPYTNHIRLRNVFLRNITVIFHNETANEGLLYLNPAIMSLPSWSKNQYLVVMRVRTDGTHQNNIFCEANVCYTDPSEAGPGQLPCTDQDKALLGGAPGLRCAMPPTSLNVPATPAAYCGHQMGILMDIPGFHDPRVFWTGKGEPLMMVNTQSVARRPWHWRHLIWLTSVNIQIPLCLLRSLGH